MRPTFMGFETTGRGLMINQKAMDIVGNNMGNIGVTGYTRQRVDQYSMNINYRHTRYNVKSSLAGQGAGISGVAQIRDTFLDKRFREEYADVGYYNASVEILSDLESAINEIQPSTLSTALTRFRDAWGEFSKDGGSDKVASANAYAAAHTLAQVFQQIDVKLDNVLQQQQYDLDSRVNEVNKRLEKIAQLNVEIRQEKATGAYSSDYYGPNELMDQRNVLLDELSEYGDIVVDAQEDGTVNVKMAGHTVIEQDQFDAITVTKGSNEDTRLLIWQSTGKQVKLTSGSLKASVELINGRGLDGKLDHGETLDNGILYYKDKIDRFALTIADAFNHMIAEVDPVTGKVSDPPAYKTLFTFGGEDDNDAAAWSAGNLRVNPVWEQDTTYILKDIQVTGEGEDQADFALLAEELFTRDLDFGEFQGTINDYITFYSTTRLGEQVSFCTTRLESCTDISANLLDRISQVSGVSYEEEATDMMQYKKTYDAISRVMTAMDEMLDKLINATGRVGL